MSAIPSDDDWHSEPWDLDAAHAYGVFAGKTIEQAIALLKENCLYYSEDIMFMPAICLRYYINAYIAYLLSEESRAAADGANGFLGLVEHRLVDLRAGEAPLIDAIEVTLRRLADRQDWYDAPAWIYGDFSSRSDELIRQLRA
jgi:hypothetical protein